MYHDKTFQINFIDSIGDKKKIGLRQSTDLIYHALWTLYLYEKLIFFVI